MSFNRIVCMNNMHWVVFRVLVLSCAVGCPLSGHYSLGYMLFVLLFSLCVQYYSLMSVLSADQSWYIAVAAVLYNQLSVALISPSCCSCHHHHSYLLSVGFWLVCHHSCSLMSLCFVLFQQRILCGQRQSDQWRNKRMTVLSIADLIHRTVVIIQELTAGTDVDKAYCHMCLHSWFPL